ncbi:uncharacterized protein BO66DRAFT_428591 [Aspergillus aculeatinus CBS 121060]|uniref:Uncharacterized protein n=1 Tax=Aspergillus aculeatinus CBS 121060 TaxID=1448322 RepID=A0ACD1H9T2_9EURO|nr:hypothetical protein BO66DRAFT_428591 [Aspergillus aculeatinus CBS 121060]RAH70520.1 hypothetical protein BO66DRAFT_428591 [Aspergillus aculeatinus CBS 121060]
MAAKTPIFTDQAPAPFPIFSQAIVHKDTVYCSGMIGLDAKSNTLVTGGVEAQTEQLLRNLDLVLQAAESGLQNILKMTVYITTMDDFAAMNRVYARHFSVPMPCDRAKPVCSTCERSRSLCDYQRPNRTPLTRRYLTQLENELNHARTLLQDTRREDHLPARLNPDNDDLGPQPPDTSAAVDPGSSLLKTRQTERCVLLPPEVAPPVASFEWDERDSTLQDASEAPVKHSGGGYFGIASTRAFLRTTGHQDEAYPPMAIVCSLQTISEPSVPLSSIGQYIDAYFGHCHPLHPFLHETAFRAQLMDLYPRPSRPLWEMLLYAVAALGAFAVSSPTDDTTDRGFFEAAKARFSSDMMETGNKTLVQALTLMSRYLRMRNKLNASYNYLGLANRTAIGIGLYKEFPTPESNPFYQEVRRRVWWSLYTLNLEDAIALSRPQDFPQAGVEVNLPLNIQDLDLTPSTPAIHAEANQTILYSGLKFTAAFYSTISKVYSSITTIPYPRARELLHYDDTLIHEWEASLPAFYRSTASQEARYSLAHALLFWRRLNFQILMYRPFIVWHYTTRHSVSPPKLPADPESVQEAIQRCQRAADESIRAIANFWFRGKHQQRSALEGWYALQFIFPAVLIPVMSVRSESSGAVAAEVAGWRERIHQALEVMDSVAEVLESATLQGRIVRSLCSGVVELNTGSDGVGLGQGNPLPSADLEYGAAAAFSATQQIL